MTEQAEVPRDHPLRHAFDAYRETAAYRNTRHWARHEEHADGSLWAAFAAGFTAAEAAIREDYAKLLEEQAQAIDRADLPRSISSEAGGGGAPLGRCDTTSDSGS